MTDDYYPASDFLVSAINEEIPFSGSPMAEENLRLLLGMVHDADSSNRDWAALLIAQLDEDTPEIRAALWHAAQDEHDDTRGEALVGLAQRDPAATLPIVREALAGEWIGCLMLQAAAELGDPSLLPILRQIEGGVEIVLPEDTMFEYWLREALRACGGGEPPG
jgi:hypothetical protein